MQQPLYFMGLELGSTRIKAVLIDSVFRPVASGEFAWESHMEDGIWTYSMEEVWSGIQAAVSSLLSCAEAKKIGTRKICSIGISGMMHGYLAFDRHDRQLVPFRTWRNTITGPAAEELSELFRFNIPQRWSIAHLHQALRNQEPHIKEVAFLTTLAGYVHWKLTGRRVLGVGDASGMFPIDSAACDYDQRMLDQYDALVSDRVPWRLRELLPRVLPAGADAGTLTPEGALLLDPAGRLPAGIPCCPPEGDAGTGMAATNSVSAGTGNVSAGTSVFSMIVLERPLSQRYPEIDMVTTPSGEPVAMVHCNNCTNEINAWAQVFAGFLRALGQEPDMARIFTAMFTSALRGSPDTGGITLYNFITGEPVAGSSAGCPLLLRSPDSKLTFADFMRAQLYSALAALKMGTEILTREQVRIDRIFGHGGFFKTPLAGQRILAAAMHTPVSVMETAGEGGPWGMALLAAYRICREEGQTLSDFLSSSVFADTQCTTVDPLPEDEDGFDGFLSRYKSFLPLEHEAAVQFCNWGNSASSAHLLK